MYAFAQVSSARLSLLNGGRTYLSAGSETFAVRRTCSSLPAVASRSPARIGYGAFHLFKI
eukprot:3286707-Pleurochrysis_carterae.AAC.2